MSNHPEDIALRQALATNVPAVAHDWFKELYRIAVSYRLHVEKAVEVCGYDASVPVGVKEPKKKKKKKPTGRTTPEGTKPTSVKKKINRSVPE